MIAAPTTLMVFMKAAYSVEKIDSIDAWAFQLE